MAWTSVGGDILFIESILSKGKGELSLIVGNLGKVMKESAIIAMQYLKGNANKYSINDKLFSELNVHLHVPEGATPKDGPSVSITMFVSLVSSFTKRKVKKRIAMTENLPLEERYCCL